MSKIENVEPLNENIIQSMISGKISLSEFKNIKKSIDDRLNYFMWRAAEIANVKLSWWDYDNGDSESETDGYFDPEVYIKKIKINGDYEKTSDNDILFEDYFFEGLPLEILFTDFEEKVRNDLKAIHESLEAKKKAEKESKIIKDKKNNDFKNMVESIRSKLTKEELKIVKFVNKLWYFMRRIK